MNQGLYLVSPDIPYSAEILLNKIKQVAEKQKIDAFLYSLPEEVSPGDIVTLQKVSSVLQNMGVAFLIKGHLDLVTQSGSDGIHLPFTPDIANIRRKIPDMALGVSCASRHEAMTAGEAGADYIAFIGEDAVENTIWWADLFNIPSVLFDPEDPCPAADFIAVTL